MARARPSPLENPRSRAARRAPSPSLNADKSLKEAPRASNATPVLAPYHGAGIQKKTKRKHLTHAQRVRHEKELAKAEANQDRLDVKVADAQARLKKRHGRRALWEDVNVDSNEEVRKAIRAPGRFGVLDVDQESRDDIQPFHGDTEIKVIGGVQVPAFATGEALNVAVAPTMVSNGKRPGTFGVTPDTSEAPTLCTSTKPPGTFGVGGRFEPAGGRGFEPAQPQETESIDEIT